MDRAAHLSVSEYPTTLWARVLSRDPGFSRVEDAAGLHAAGEVPLIDGTEHRVSLSEIVSKSCAELDELAAMGR